MTEEENHSSGAGALTESLQLQALALSVKALIATHPKPEELQAAMHDLFAQFQASAVFLNLSAPQRDWARKMFEQLLPSPPDSTQ